MGFDTLLALAAIFLALSLAVEVIQEIHKFFTTSKARAYRKALTDFLGVSVDQQREERLLEGMLLRGPFQWLARQRPAHLLPADAAELVRALERATMPSVQGAVQAFRDEAARQAGTLRSPSPALRLWFERVQESDSESTHEILRFLYQLGIAAKPAAKRETRREAKPGEEAAGSDSWKLAEKDLDAASVVDGLYDRFIPKARTVQREFDQFSKNFEYAYRRRNLRQTLVIAFLVAIGLDLSLGGLFQHARSLSAEQVSKLAESAVKLQDSIQMREEDDAATSEPGATPGQQPAKQQDSMQLGAPKNSQVSEPKPGVQEKEAPDDDQSSEPEPQDSKGDDAGAATNGDVGTKQDDVAPPVNTEEEVEAGEDDKNSGQDSNPKEETATNDGQASDAATSSTQDGVGTDLEQELTKLVEDLDKAVKLVLTLGADRQVLQPIWRAPEGDKWDFKIIRANLKDRRHKLAEYVATAILIAFGAPFWHRLSKALLAVGRSASGASADSSGEQGSES